jgi:FtsP/CotA-like multicopper oxidase with cupredoxin domain
MHQKNRLSVTSTQSPSPHWSRRRFLEGAGLTLSGLIVPRPGLAQARPEALILHARAGSAALRGQTHAASPITGFEGASPGPLLRVRRGDELRISIANELSDSLAVHWHGVRVPNAMDGVPYLTQNPIAAGASFDYRFTPPDAGTFWYHARLSAAGGSRGLYGALIVDETQPVEVDHDVLLMFDEWRLAADGAPGRAQASDAAATRHPTINGGPSFDIPVRGNERLRLRLVNASLRALTLRMERHRIMVLAVDGQPAQPYYARDSRVLLGPGNRMDLLVDVDPDSAGSSAIMLEGERDTPLARLLHQASGPARPNPRPEARALPASSLPERMDFRSALKLDIPISDTPERADLQALAKTRPLFSVKRGRTVMLGIVNRTKAAHAMHLHGHHFRLLDALDDGWKPFWMDTLPIPVSQTGRIAFVADNPGKWLIRCHRLDEEETSMAAWFEVTS